MMGLGTNVSPASNMAVILGYLSRWLSRNEGMKQSAGGLTTLGGSSQWMYVVRSTDHSAKSHEVRPFGRGNVTRFGRKLSMG